MAAVVHYDPPADGATYVHRSGRTARAGAGGVVVSLVEPAVEADIPGIQRGAGITGPITAPRLDHLAAAPTPAPESAAATPAPTVPEARHQQRAAAAASKRSKVRPLHQTSAGNRRGGTIRYFHRNRGFGFIAADHGPDVFVHHSNAPRTIGRGQRVEYRVRESERGLEAIDVVIL